MDLKVLCLGIVLAVSSFGSSLGGGHRKSSQYSDIPVMADCLRVFLTLNV